LHARNASTKFVGSLLSLQPIEYWQSIEFVLNRDVTVTCINNSILIY